MPETAPRVWVTRTRPDAVLTAERLRALGLDPLVSPLLRVRRLRPRVDPAAWGALALTSRNAVAALTAVTDPAAWVGRPVFTVGDATADAARAAGFADVRSASGDVHALAAVIGAARPPEPVMVAGPRSRAADLPALLAARGVAARAVAVHATLPAPARRGFSALAERRLAAVLIHSPRAAETLAARLRPAIGPEMTTCERPIVVAISDAAARALNGLGLPVAVADHPDEPALLAALARALGKPRPPV